MNELALLIKKLREDKGFSQRQLAQYTGISNTEISQLEKGNRQKPNPNILKKIAPKLGTTYSVLMTAAGYTEDEIIMHEETDELLTLFKNLPNEEKNAIVTIWEDGYSFADLRKGLLTFLKAKK